MTVKSLVKKLFFTCCAVIMLPFSLSYLLLKGILGKDSLLSAYSQLLSLLPGKTGSYLRAGFYRLVFTGCSPDAMISFGALFSKLWRVKKIFLNPVTAGSRSHDQSRCVSMPRPLGCGVALPTLRAVLPP